MISYWYITYNSNLLCCLHVICSGCDEGPTSLTSENWLIKLSKELEDQGIYLPERWVSDLHASGDSIPYNPTKQCQLTPSSSWVPTTYFFYLPMYKHCSRTVITELNPFLFSWMSLLYNRRYKKDIEFEK